MTQKESQEYRGKVINMGDSLRGWIPTGVATELKARSGDYFVFRRNAIGKVTLTVRRATAMEKRKSAARTGKKR